MLADIELTGIITDDHRVGQKAMRFDAAPRQRRCHHRAVRRLPTLAAEIHDVRPDQKILHHIIRVVRSS
jgi:hypothetical protein